MGLDTYFYIKKSEPEQKEYTFVELQNELSQLKENPEFMSVLSRFKNYSIIEKCSADW